jgi:hypothetical protein
VAKHAGDARESKNENPSSTERRGVRAGDSLRASMQLMTAVMGGTAGAVSEGCQAFADELSEDSVRERGLLKGFVEGVIAGQTRFLRGLAETGDRVQESFRDLERESSERPTSEPIDYERLAKALAAAIRQEDAKGQGDARK